eukprot:m.432392 g.432392  ORF g.432392 m.432392 type:complete len:71 (+) comp17427_c0_seq1:1320-1532(+)
MRLCSFNTILIMEGLFELCTLGDVGSNSESLSGVLGFLTSHLDDLTLSSFSRLGKLIPMTHTRVSHFLSA